MILISLLGDDLSILSPIINEYKDQIKHHILLHDDAPDDIRRSKQFNRGLERFIRSNKLKWSNETIILDEDSKHDIVRVYHTLRAKYDGPFHLHSTEGFAATALILSNLILMDQGKVITYDHNENEQTIIEGTTITKVPLISRLDIDGYLELLNFNILEIQRHETLVERKNEILTLFKDYHTFLNLRNALSKNDTKFDYDRHSNLLQILHDLEILDNSYQLIPLERPRLEGYLFEEYVYWICSELAFDDIVLGAKIDLDQGDEPEQQNRVLNEFDILMTKNNRIHTVECKMVRHLDGLEFIYKYDGLIDIFGSGTRAIILNIANKEMRQYKDSKVSQNFRPAAIRRARMGDIEIYHDNVFSPYKFQTLAKNFFLKQS